jgi:hypothetical protein
MLKFEEITPTNNSLVYPDYSIAQILVEMIEWVFDNEVKNQPHIVWISIEQLIWGKGMHWKEKECPEQLQLGIIKHLKISKASKALRNILFKSTGWELPEWPFDLYCSIKFSVKEKIISSIIREKKYGGINAFCVRSYINSEKELPTFDLIPAGDPQSVSNILGWFFYRDNPDFNVIFSADHKCRGKQNNWISKQDLRTRFQLALTQDTHSDCLIEIMQYHQSRNEKESRNEKGLKRNH